MKTGTPNRQSEPGQHCLGCRNCTGVCLELLALAVVPDTILHRPARAG